MELPETFTALIVPAQLASGVIYVLRASGFQVVSGEDKGEEDNDF